VTLAVALLALVAPKAFAQNTVSTPQQAGGGNPLAPFTPAPTPTGATPTVATTTTSSSGGGLSGGAAVAIGVGALVVLGGISLFIWRDARKRAPVRHRPAEATAGGPGSRQRQKSRKLSPAERKRRKRGRAR
jgi:hypothetical protein